jgi:hypothetical protein
VAESAGRLAPNCGCDYDYPTVRMSLHHDWISAIGVDQVLAGQGIDPASDSPILAALREAAAHAIDTAVALLDPRVASGRVGVDRVADGCVHLAGGLVIRSGAVAACVDCADQLAAAVCTVGDDVSQRAAALMDTDPVAALALEGLACAGVDALAAAVCRDERARAGRLGLRVSAPLSPGTDEWPLLAGQRAIFDLVDAAAIEVRLGESGQMRPCKSSSFVVGIGARVRQDGRGRCERCSARPACRWSAGRHRASGGV